MEDVEADSPESDCGYYEVREGQEEVSGGQTGVGSAGPADSAGGSSSHPGPALTPPNTLSEDCGESKISPHNASSGYGSGQESPEVGQVGPPARWWQGPPAPAYNNLCYTSWNCFPGSLDQHNMFPHYAQLHQAAEK